MKKIGGLEGRKIGYLRRASHADNSLPSYHPTFLSSKLAPTPALPHGGGKRAAFTLAEVLITLGIIGIVAAMTLPTLITNYREKQRVTQVKKTYSMLQQAFLMAVEKHGDAEHWDLAVTNTGKEDLDGNPIYDFSGSEKIISYLAENLNVQKNNSSIVTTIYTLDGTFDCAAERLPERYLKLNDGTILYIGWTNPTFTDIIVYYPGCEKHGCRTGKDYFYFRILFKNNKGVMPHGYNTKNQFSTSCSRNKTGSINGRDCTVWVIENENMDYLHCDDLSWSGKTKCK